MSAPLPPVRLSLPFPPNRVSFPLLPTKLSFPVDAQMISFPFPPFIVISLSKFISGDVRSTTSSPFPAFIISIEVTLLVKFLP